MKQDRFKAVSINNRKKQIETEYTSGKKYTLHYSQLGLNCLVADAWVDAETNGRSIGILLSDGTADYMPYDQPLALNKDPQFLLQNQMEVLIARIKIEIKKKKMSKRYLALRLKTSDNQVQRLLNPKILKKNLEQLYLLASLVGLNLELRAKSQAA